MSARDIYDFEGAVEPAAKSVLADLNVTAFTSRDVPDFQKDRPRVELKFTLNAGLERFVPLVMADGKWQIANPGTAGVTPASLFYGRRESVWGFKLQFDLLTDADIDVHADYRAVVRCALAQFWALINRPTLLPRHCVQMGKDNGASPILIAPEQGIMKTEMSFEGTISVQAGAWAALNT